MRPASDTLEHTPEDLATLWARILGHTLADSQSSARVPAVLRPLNSFKFVCIFRLHLISSRWRTSSPFLRLFSVCSLVSSSPVDRFKAGSHRNAENNLRSSRGLDRPMWNFFLIYIVIMYGDTRRCSTPPAKRFSIIPLQNYNENYKEKIRIQMLRSIVKLFDRQCGA